MKHKVKLVKVEDDIITLRVDGELCSYLIERPSPLSLVDVKMLRGMMDSRLVESMLSASGLGRVGERPIMRLLRWVGSVVLRRIDKPIPDYITTGLCDSIADYIEKVGVEVNIGEKSKGIVLLKGDVDKIRKGGEL